jgi:Spy/CpxP family protein refolding chaperone
MQHHLKGVQQMKRKAIASLPILALTAAFALTVAVTVNAGPAGQHSGPRPFAAGKGPGGPGGEHGLRGGDRPTTVVMEMLSKRLDLTDDQKAKIAPILDNTRSELRKTAEGTKAILQKSKEEIQAVLTDEQKGKLEKMKETLGGAVGGYLRANGPEIKERVHDAGQEIALRAALGSLDLTDEQRSKLKDLQSEVEKKREAIQAELKPKMEELKKEVKTKLEATLTDEQKSQLKERIEQMREAGPGGRGPGRGPDRNHAGPPRADAGPGAEGRPHPGPMANAGDELLGLFSN